MKNLWKGDIQKRNLLQEKRMKDAAVETIRAVPDEEKREDVVNEAIETYIKAKKQLGYGGMLPPDVFLGLKFSDAGTTTEVRSHLQSVLTLAFALTFYS